MKKIFKGLAILAATATVGAGAAFAAGCGGKDGKYIGYYAYDSYNNVYGMVVEVTVKNNIITNVSDVTKTYVDDEGVGKISYSLVNSYTGQEMEIDCTQWHVVSDGWEVWIKAGGSYLWANNEEIKGKIAADPNYVPTHEELGYNDYEWYQDNVDDWNKYENWLLQQYIGWSVSDIRDISVYYNANGEPYEAAHNTELNSSGLIHSGATQGSGRLLLAVQNALCK